MFVPPIAAIGGRPWCGRFAMTAQVIERDRLGALTKIGQGGQGVVYGAPNVKTKFADSMVYKAYKAPTRAEIDFGALAAMPALVEDSLLTLRLNDWSRSRPGRVPSSKTAAH
jgi:hypothetical protein